MRHTSAAAALLATAVIGGLGLAPSAADAQSGPATVRAAWIKSCTNKKDDTSYPCGHWQLLMRDGSKREVRDASATRVDVKGNKIYDNGMFAVSADGGTIVYERASDHRLVVRKAAGGAATALPKALTARGTDSIVLYVSPAGDRVLVDSTEDGRTLPTLVYTVATGKTVKLPGAEGPVGFSADGDEVLAMRYPTDNTAQIIVHRLDGTTIKKTPPQVVANAAADALAADGKTVAVFVSGNTDRNKPPRLRMYDVETGDLTQGVDLALKPGSTPYRAYWTADGQLRAIVSSGDDGKPAVVRVLTVDPESGHVTQADKFSISKHRYTYFTAGE
ncbi:hypothetical protein [Nonomuraea sediminis]|uniref:hypothetical protein n=1 Tax=Nonomuraea sediminis TaxID=2835864 RepID=UPI001BDDA644|nr:hypothetical protein [Nonomuraea sediminis]